ncbi:MAG TPA: type II toxin-antitoxin system VapC family toxin [Thermoanaerobaculia bacterium]|nr:type II toxin-antitoxin system VapC family toxin [Thermoanaerobaculia bacterium]
MIVYLDSSVLLRFVFREPNPLQEWNLVTVPITSALTRVEAARAMDRNTLLNAAPQPVLDEKSVEIGDILTRVDFVGLDADVLEQAARPLPVVLGALDAIHLASAVLYRATQPPDERPILFATHDTQLAKAARAMQFEVIGA